MKTKVDPGLVTVRNLFKRSNRDENVGRSMSSNSSVRQIANNCTSPPSHQNFLSTLIYIKDKSKGKGKGKVVPVLN
jgi:hypothetical protein